MEIKRVKNQKLPSVVEKKPIKEGIIKEGNIQDISALSEELSFFREKYKKYKFVDIALPEELAFVFDVKMPAFELEGKNLMELVEYKLGDYVPFDASLAIFDAQVIKKTEKYAYLSVVAYPQEIITEYAEAIEASGFVLRFAELETVSMARAVKSEQDSNFMVIDFGNHKMTLTIMLGELPAFSTTFMVNTKDLYKKLLNGKELSEEELNKWKFEKGLVYLDSRLIDEAMGDVIENLRRYISFWDSEKSEDYGKIEKIYTCGGNASLKGFDAYLSGKLGIVAKQGNVWKNLFDLDSFLPQVNKRESFMYATVTGLAAKDKLEIC